MLGIKNVQAATEEIYGRSWLDQNISLSVLRLDALHPVISGNKIFKLHYFLEKAVQKNFKIITFGGAYSNHLYATAAACRHFGLQCIGIVRGEKPVALSTTLSFCRQQGMRLEFISRMDYRQKGESSFQQNLVAQFGAHILIPEGGFNTTGMKGAADIYDHLSGDYSYICCPVGSGTTLAGLSIAASSSQQIIGFSALRGPDQKKQINTLLNNSLKSNYCVIEAYNFGGYAKKTTELISFMNQFYSDHRIPLDFVYTGKMMYGVVDLLRQRYFAEKSRIICIHTGGMQGNSSLIPGTLNY